MSTQLPVTEARSQFSEILATCAHQPVFLTKHGERQAVLLSVTEYERLLEAAEDLEDLLQANLALAEIQAGLPTVPWAQVKADLGLV